jgi:hypothetical protein
MIILILLYIASFAGLVGICLNCYTTYVGELKYKVAVEQRTGKIAPKVTLVLEPVAAIWFPVSAYLCQRYHMPAVLEIALIAVYAFLAFKHSEAAYNNNRINRPPTPFS